jgi:hypothetical protein
MLKMYDVGRQYFHLILSSWSLEVMSPEGDGRRSARRGRSAGAGFWFGIFLPPSGNLFSILCESEFCVFCVRVVLRMFFHVCSKYHSISAVIFQKGDGFYIKLLVPVCVEILFLIGRWLTWQEIVLWEVWDWGSWGLALGHGLASCRSDWHHSQIGWSSVTEFVSSSFLCFLSWA